MGCPTEDSCLREHNAGCSLHLSYVLLRSVLFKGLYVLKHKERAALG